MGCATELNMIIIWASPDTAHMGPRWVPDGQTNINTINNLCLNSKTNTLAILYTIFSIFFYPIWAVYGLAHIYN